MHDGFELRRVSDHLAEELVSSGWDTRHVLRLIFRSRTYQQSAIPRHRGPDAARFFASYPVRRLDAEVLVDALTWIGGEGEGYMSRIPEPYTFVPDGSPSVFIMRLHLAGPTMANNESPWRRRVKLFDGDAGM